MITRPILWFSSHNLTPVFRVWNIWHICLFCLCVLNYRLLMLTVGIVLCEHTVQCSWCPLSVFLPFATGRACVQRKTFSRALTGSRWQATMLTILWCHRWLFQAAHSASLLFSSYTDTQSHNFCLEEKIGTLKKRNIATIVFSFLPLLLQPPWLISCSCRRHDVNPTDITISICRGFL